ncbi:MAG: hypothetical protein Q6K70_07165 [Thermostichales cyanobacterium DRC_bins_46]
MKQLTPYLRVGIPLAVLLLVTAVWTWPVWQRGYPITHSTQFNLSWAFQYQAQFRAGQFYPRWLEYSNFGFGNATFAFYPPLCMVATLPFALLGADLPTSLILSNALAIFLAGAGLYVAARTLLPLPWWGALGVAVLGMSGHYFLGDFWIRGAMGEGWAVAVIPWIFWRTGELLRTGRGVVALALAYGMLVLSHLPTLLIFTLVWIPFLWICTRNPTLLGRAYAGLGLGLLWTSFYLLPAFLDQPLVQVDGVNFSDEYKPQFRLMLSGILRLQPQITQHWYEQTLLRYWWLTVATFAVGWLGSPLPWGWLWLTGIPIAFMTDMLGWLYPWVQALQRIQFSWRWLAVTSISVPMLLGSRFPWPWRRGRWGQVLRQVAVGAVVLGLAGLWLYDSVQMQRRIAFRPDWVQTFSEQARRKVTQYPQEPQRSPRQNFLYWHWLMPDGMGIVDVPEYRALGVVYPMPPPEPVPLAAWQTPQSGTITIERWVYGRRQIQATNASSTPQVLLLRTFYYPAWQVSIDGRRQPSERSPQGQLQITLPPGSHQIRVEYGTTFWEAVGRLLTFATPITLLGLKRWRSQIFNFL